MGDSITKIAEPTYISKFQDWTPTTVEGLVSRQISGGVSPDGLTELSNDQAKISQAHAIVIALGTNGVTNPAATTTSEVRAAMTKIKQYNTQNAPVFWVNVLDTRYDAASQTTNQAISDGVGSDATVIDWYSEAKSKADLGSFQGGVHPTKQSDIDLLVNLVYNAVAGGQSGGAATSGAGKTIVIDPGHGPNMTTVDSQTGLKMIESNNVPEITDVWDVAQLAKKDLEAAGYKVVLTKTSIDQNVTFRQRADIANNNHADLAFSIHGDPGLPDPGEIFVQKDGLYRGSGANKTVFDDPQVATTSQTDAQVFQQERQKDQGESVVIKDDSFDGRAPIEPGNISMVQLFSKVPWVYNEQKMPFDHAKYAQSLVDSAKQILGGSGSQGSAASASSCCPTSVGASGSLPSSLTGVDPEHQIYNFFLQVGLSPAQSAGIVANFLNESGFDPNSGGSPSGGVYGVAQWTPGSHLTDDLTYFQQHGLISSSASYSDLLTQLQVVWLEMNGKDPQSTTVNTDIATALKQINDPGAAAIYFRENFERCNIAKPSCADRGTVAATEYRKLAGSGSATASTGSGTGCASGGSPDCTSATGNAKILCEAKLYAGIYYEWDGGHSGYNGPYSKFIKGCPDPANPPNNQPNGGPVNGDTGGNSGNPSPCGLDCSGLVTIAVNAAFNQAPGFKQGTEWSTYTLVSDTANWKAINVRLAQAGDVVEPNPDHVQIVDHYDAGSGTLSIFQSLGTGFKIGPATAPASDYSTAYHYIGPGSN